MATTPSGRGRMPRSMPPSATSARKSVRVHAWLKDHPDCPSHFMPAAGTDAVEGLFSKPSRQRLKKRRLQLPRREHRGCRGMH